MPDYQKMYAELFISVTKAIELLKQAQITTEEIYITSDECRLILLPKYETKDKETH